jgi:hypothetical protein
VRIEGIGWKAVFVVLVGVLAVPVGASAHLERPSYWPDPRPDRSISPAAGGGVPKARSLVSAVDLAQFQPRPPAYTGQVRRRPREQVRVVCKRNSLGLAMRSIRQARRQGYRLRPSQPRIRLSQRQAQRLRQINRALADMCRFRHVQPAINRSGNNGRIVIMPGVYREPNSRRQPENDPRCDPSMLQRDASGNPTPSYEYQVTCPHDQNLIYVQGREVVGEPEDPPREDRRGIPEQEHGPCVKCNLQIEGSGAKPEDVILDAGRRYQGTGPEKKPRGHAKHVVLRVDRADGFVGKNMLMRGGLEFGFYTEETDGVLLDRTKFFWNADYGHLSFTSDHHVVKNCDGMGAGDAVVYPGATPETGSQATKDFWPDAPRHNTVIRDCDLRHSALGYSGSMGNGVRITRNHVYANTTGIATDTLSSAGHPGFPSDSLQIDNNYIYSNNLDVYRPDTPVEPLVGVPIGTGVIMAGKNDARIRNNWIFDNWRDGTMLFAVPDALTTYGGPEGLMFPGVSCLTSPAGGTEPTSGSGERTPHIFSRPGPPGVPGGALSTSCGNHQFNNRMGQKPPGFRYPPGIGKFGSPRSPISARTMPNGNDFWWDEFPSNRWNCWYRNTGPDGSPGSITGPGEAGNLPAPPPPLLPDCANGTNQDLSVGWGDVVKEAYLIECSEGPDSDTGGMACDWWNTPPRPGSAQAASKERESAAAAAEFERSPEAKRLRERMEALAGGGG